MVQESDLFILLWKADVPQVAKSMGFCQQSADRSFGMKMWQTPEKALLKTKVAYLSIGS